MTLLSIESALEQLLRDVLPVAEVEELPLRVAANRVLAADLVALRTQPDFDASAMDGYALRAEDLVNGEPLRLIGTSAAGRAFDGVVSPGEAVRIFTGAPLPAGADAVLIQEDAERLEGDRVRATEAIEAGRNIRRAGNDFAEGATLLRQGARLTAGMIALAASGGHPRLPVLRRPRVAILATGDELVEPGEIVGPSQIVASNTYGVAALVEANGGEVLDLGIAPDDLDVIGGRLDRAKSEGADIFVTIGGASVGDHDLAAKAFESRGVSLDFWKVAMRPGKPIMAGRLGPMRIVGLPGNPASSMVAATVFLRPLLRALAGLDARVVYRNGRLGLDMPANDHRAEFVRSALHLAEDGELSEVHPLPRQDSSLLSIYAAAEVLLFRPANAPAAPAGSSCRYLALD